MNRSSRVGPWRGLEGFMPLVLGVVAASQLACTRSAAIRPAPRLVLMYATCSVNKNYLAAYNPRISYTPNIREFARSARVFARAQTESAQSGIAFAALWTGTQAMRHGIYAHPEILAATNRTIAEAYTQHGYATYFWDTHGMVAAELGYGQGVESNHVIGHMLKADDPRFVSLLAKLKSDPQSLAFVMTNHSVTHGPYGTDRVESFCAQYPQECCGVNPDEIARFGRPYHENYLDLSFNYQETVARLRLSPDEAQKLISVIELVYKSRINYLDDLFGNVIKAISDAGLLDQSLIVLTSDHGEILYQKNAPLKWTHFTLSPDELSVPLIIRGPGITPGTHEEVTRSIDVLPTLAGLMGFRLPRGSVMGVDLSPSLRLGRAEPVLVAYSHTSLVPKPVLEASKTWTLFHRLFPDFNIDGVWVASREGDTAYKLRWLDGRDAAPEVYDWAADPAETRNLFDPANRHHREMVEKLRAYKVELKRGFLQSRQGRSSLSDKERIERLRSLGYIN